MDIAVMIVGLVALVLAIFDTIQIVLAFLTETNPFMIILQYALYVLSLINIVVTLENILLYWQTGDCKYESELFMELIMNIFFAGLFKLLDFIALGIKVLFNCVKNLMDKIAEIVAKFGDEVAEAVARYGKDAIDAIRKYGDDEVEALTLYGDDALKAIVD